jgi:hypothetical protein
MSLIVVPGLWDSSSVVTLKMSCRGLAVNFSSVDYQMAGINRQRILLA